MKTTNTQTTNKISRRDFLKLAGVTLGASAAACSGLGRLATIQPEVDFVEDHYQGENKINQSILVAYASKVGSTGDVALAIGKTLSLNGAFVDVYPIDQVTNIDNYQAVVVGSAIRTGRWIPSATNFVENHKSYLRQVPTAFFTCCMTLHEETEENRQTALDYMTPVSNIVEPVAIGAFAGKMDYTKLSFLDQTIIKLVGVPEGDFRNWEQIKNWTIDTHPALLKA